MSDTIKMPTCDGCGGILHGSVNGQLHCLRYALAAERQIVKELRARLTKAQEEASLCPTK